MSNFPELFQHIHQTYGLDLTETQKAVIEKVLLSRKEILKMSDRHRAFFNALPADDFLTEKALLIGHRKGLSRATVFRILSNQSLFLKIGHGIYQRLF